jgi:predicted nucleic acid-binding protein
LIVLDASAAYELLTDTATGSGVARRLIGEAVNVPAHFDIETAGAIRRQTMRGELSAADEQRAYDALRRMRVQRWTVESSLDRAWTLRQSLTIADGLYVALAEALGAPLLTCDVRLARSHGHDAVIEPP